MIPSNLMQTKYIDIGEMAFAPDKDRYLTYDYHNREWVEALRTENIAMPLMHVMYDNSGIETFYYLVADADVIVYQRRETHDIGALKKISNNKYVSDYFTQCSCVVCKKPITYKELGDIRDAWAPFKHKSCEYKPYSYPKDTYFERFIFWWKELFE